MNRKIPAAALGFVLLLIFVSVLSCGAILLLPDDLPQLGPENYPGNIMNQSRIAAGKDIVYYASPAGGVYKLFSDTVTKISDDHADFVYAHDEGPVFGTDTGVYKTLHDGSLKAKLLDNDDNLLVIGRWVYYTDQIGQLVKTRMDDNKTFELGICPKGGKYYISAGRLFYIGEDDMLYTARTDGSNVEKLIDTDTRVAGFMFRGNELFFIDTSGELGYTRLTSNPVVRSYGKVDSFNVIGTTLVFVKEGALYAVQFDSSAVDLEQMNPVKLGEGRFENLSVDEKYIYFFDQNQQLVRMLPDGSEKKVF
ncbi:MAG TPA: DUF5050 domain-containing protein [Clostridiales bacterium]|nr:DUF5050 domain-containing protein [Clostridiales bacterium]